MIDIQSVTFPIAGEVLADLQQKEVGRELTSIEREFFNELAATVNEAFTAAATKADIRTARRLLLKILFSGGFDAYSRHLKGLCIGWIDAAVNAGLEHYESEKAKS